MRAVLLIARRELLATVRTWTFVLGTSAALAVLVGFVLAQSSLLSSPRASTVGLSGQALSLAAPLTDTAHALGREVSTRDVTDLAQGERMVESGELDALVSGNPSALHVLVRQQLDEDLRTALDTLVRQQVLRAQLAAVEDLDPNLVLSTVDNATVEVRALHVPDPQHGQRLVLALVAAGTVALSLLVVAVVVAVGVARTLVDRLAETLLAAVSPRELVLGRVAGVGAAGLGQLALVGTAGLLLALGTDVLTLAGVAGRTLLWSLLWCVLGIVLYGPLSAMAGALAARLEDVAAVLAPVVLPVVVGFGVGVPVLVADPAGPLASVLSLLPPFAPVLMPGRLALAAVPAWQLAVAAVLVLATAAAFGKLGWAGYRNAVLHTGGRPRIRDLMR